MDKSEQNRMGGFKTSLTHFLKGGFSMSDHSEHFERREAVLPQKAKEVLAQVHKK